MHTQETIRLESDNYVHIPIVQMLNHPNFFKEISTYIKASDKYIKLNYAEDSFEGILSSLLWKGGTHVYLTSDDMANLLNSYQVKMLESDINFDEEVFRDLHIKENETILMLAQAFIRNSGLSPEVKSMIEGSNHNIQMILTKSPTIKSLLDKFKQNCSDEFFKITLTNYICSLILNHFPWKTSLILDKLMLASTLCDLCLDASDMADLEAYEDGSGPLTENVRNHPLNVIDMIKANSSLIPMETVTIIKQHHERPNGKGFPFGLDHSRINQLSTIFIVAHSFVDKITQGEYEGGTYLEVAEEISREYVGGCFTKSSTALVTEIAKLK
jgi:hypothetical protein